MDFGVAAAAHGPRHAPEDIAVVKAVTGQRLIVRYRAVAVCHDRINGRHILRARHAVDVVKHH